MKEYIKPTAQLIICNQNILTLSDAKGEYTTGIPLKSKAADLYFDAENEE